MARDYYGILNISKDASDNEIKKAYRKLARKYHPDVNDTPEAAEKFSDISLAQEVLLDPEKRRIVDMGGDPMQQGGGGQHPGFGGGFGDIFDAFFGGGGGGRGPISRVRPGDDALVRLSITLEDAFQGVDEEITIDTAVVCDICHGSGSKTKAQPVRCSRCQGSGHIEQMQRSFLGNMLTTVACPVCEGFGDIIEDPCDKCAGHGRVRTRRNKSVRIPAGIASGMQLRLSGEGEVGLGGGPAGDLYIEITVAPHPIFEREGDHLHFRANIPMVDAALGTDLSVTGLDGAEITFEIPAGTQPGEVVTIEEKGMKQLRADSFGNMIAHINVMVPRELDEQSRKILQSLRDHRQDLAQVHESADDNSFFSRIRNKFRK
ncbi:MULTISPECIES: molecular chaperone DnaJ [unclassified Corynebacterium]|uniref:molecular chaperone DnaJ n=1 Tax=unclassified Corynebacterium TaxID=2624378 RepID=UPI0021682DA8|nr:MULTISPECIES: molecular chaperone DnaJ [unclassified Corynebacterium]MCS4490577.1 molecular chaperone DnaJ [Corynebacterium sp. ES2775-CONJ]MCS4532452.1 molecular chaperone DnaJ [Corynebacterium sp. ES2730-CONJ]